MTDFVKNAGDIVTEILSGNLDTAAYLQLPDDLSDLPVAQLRVSNGIVVDAAGYSSFFIDDTGRKHVVQAEQSWQPLDCSHDAQLIFDNVWRIELSADLLAAEKITAKARVIAFADSITDTIMAAYPQAKINSWAEQASQARRVVDGGETLAADELLTKLAAKSGDTVAVYAASVLVKAASFEAITIEVKDLRDQSDAAIDAVTVIGDIAPLLLTLKAQAEATAAGLGIVV